MSSDTPRTDAVTSYIPLSQLARQLERELAEAKPYLKEGETIVERFARYHKEVTDLMGRLAADKRRHIERDAIDEQQAQATARLVAERDAAMKDAERYRVGYDAAIAFVDSHAADHDITAEMRKTYAVLQERRAAIDAARKPTAPPTE